MKFLITGAYGFVGTNLCRFLAARGHECLALDISTARREGLPYSEFYSWDDLEKIPQVDIVVHLAGKAHDLKKVACEQSYFDINVGLTQRIFNVLRGRLATEGQVGRSVSPVKFIYFSSSKADANGNAYGRSKFAAEQWLVEQYASSNLKPQTSNLSLQTIILRPAMIHGPGNKGNLNLLWGVARRGIPWPLAAFENKRSFTSIGNICAAVEALAARGENGVYPIADDDMISTNRLIELMAEACGRTAKLWRLPKGLMTLAAKMGDILHLPLNTERLGKLTENSFVDNAKLKALLGWTKMPVDAESGMRETLKSFKEAGK